MACLPERLKLFCKICREIPFHAHSIDGHGEWFWEWNSVFPDEVSNGIEAGMDGEEKVAVMDPNCPSFSKGISSVPFIFFFFFF